MIAITVLPYTTQVIIAKSTKSHLNVEKAASFPAIYQALNEGDSATITRVLQDILAFNGDISLKQCSFSLADDLFTIRQVSPEEITSEQLTPQCLSALQCSMDAYGDEKGLLYELPKAYLNILTTCCERLDIELVDVESATASGLRSVQDLISEIFLLTPSADGFNVTFANVLSGINKFLLPKEDFMQIGVANLTLKKLKELLNHHSKNDNSIFQEKLKGASQRTQHIYVAGVPELCKNSKAGNSSIIYNLLANRILRTDLPSEELVNYILCLGLLLKYLKQYRKWYSLPPGLKLFDLNFCQLPTLPLNTDQKHKKPKTIATSSKTKTKSSETTTLNKAKDTLEADEAPTRAPHYKFRRFCRGFSILLCMLLAFEVGSIHYFNRYNQPSSELLKQYNETQTKLPALLKENTLYTVASLLNNRESVIIPHLHLDKLAMVAPEDFVVTTPAPKPEESDTANSEAPAPEPTVEIKVPPLSLIDFTIQTSQPKPEEIANLSPKNLKEVTQTILLNLHYKDEHAYKDYLQLLQQDKFFSSVEADQPKASDHGYKVTVKLQATYQPNLKEVNP